MPALKHDIRRGLRSKLITPLMLERIEAVRTQLDPNHACANLPVTSRTICSTVSNVERKTGWNLFIVTRMSQRVYAWIVDESAAPFFTWMAANPQGGKDWPRPPEKLERRETYARTLSVGYRAIQ